MKILGVFHGYPPVHCAGAEMYAHHMLRWFAERGHGCRVVVPAPMLPGQAASYVLEGVEMLSMDHYDYRREVSSADVVMSHLDMSVRTITACQQAHVPCVNIVHNPTSLTHYKIKPWELDLAIFNSYWLATRTAELRVPASVLYPPVFGRDYEFPQSEGSRDHVTLINCNVNKGGPFVSEMARLDGSARKYLMVRGAYPPNEQNVPHLPNVVAGPHTDNMRENVYKKTRVLLVPSLHETWGRVAIEALWAGIPVIANSLCTQPGLREALGDAAIWAPRSDVASADEARVWLQELERLEDNSVYEKASRAAVARARALETETIDQLFAVEKHFLQLVNRSQRSRVHFFAEEIHYLKHLAPVARELHPDACGYAVVPDGLRAASLKEGLLTYSYPMKADNMPAIPPSVLHATADPLTSLGYVVGTRDHIHAKTLGYPVFRAEHGIGQTYVNTQSTSYAGSPQHRELFGYAAPGPAPERVQQLAHPTIPTYRIGLPYLDAFPALDLDQAKGVGFVFHWNNTARPETAATWPYWKEAISQLPGPVFLHCHPREVRAFKNAWAADFNDRIVWVDTLEELHSRAHVICGDNTSALFILAALGHPAVSLDHLPSQGSHGLRFALQTGFCAVCAHADKLKEAVETARQSDPTEQNEMLAQVFYRLRGASVVQALLLEKLLEFRRSRDGAKAWATVRVRQSIDVSPYGPMVKNSLHSVKTEEATSLAKRGLCQILTGAELKPYEWPKEDPMRIRAPGEILYRVEEKFRENGVEYRPGDMVRKTEIRPEFLSKCSPYEPKARSHPKGTEFK